MQLPLGEKPLSRYTKAHRDERLTELAEAVRKIAVEGVIPPRLSCERPAYERRQNLVAVAKRYRYHHRMPALHIRNVPEGVLAALKRRASAHHRSLQQELLNVLREVALDAPPAEPLPPLELTLSAAADGGSWRREEIYGDDER